MRLLLPIFFLLVSLHAGERELVPYSKTKFGFIDKEGKEHDIDMEGKDFILVSVREENSDGRFYAVDRDGTVWLSGGISSGEEVEFTPSGRWKALYKKRFHTSTVYPNADGSNNMDYSIFFTPWGHALHEGNIEQTSHGCIHVDTHNIKSLFKWIKLGMPILVTRYKYMEFARPDLRRIYVRRKKSGGWWK